MGWECITDSCEIINGEFNGQGLAYYSVSNEIKTLHEVFFDYLMNLTPGMMILYFTLAICVLIFYVFLNIKDKIQDGY